MTQPRRFLDRALIAGAVIMALVTLVLVVTTIRTMRDTSQGFRGNLAFYAGQVEYETIQLLDHIDRFADGDQQVARDDVLTRFDILWSRVYLERDQEALRGDPTGLPETEETITLAREVLTEVEPAILSLERTDTETIATLKNRLRDLIPVAHRLALAAKDDKARTEANFLRIQLRQAYITFAFITGMFLFGVLSIMRLMADRGEIRRMNAELEDRVRNRTADLEAANTRLAGEIVERKRNQALAAEREARLSQAAQLAKLGYYIWDAVEDRCEYCSDQHAAAHGLTPEEYICRASHIDGSLSLTHPDDRERIRAKFRELRAGNIIEMAYRVATPSGPRRIREIARPIFDENGRVVKEVGSTLDVTDQYETEMKLFEAQRMDSIGKLTGGIAHDFNNLLAVVLGNLELLREVDDPKAREEMIGDAINATLKGRDLTLNMLSFARRAPLDPTEIDLNAVVRGMEPLLRRALPENISMEIRLSDPTWTVLADRSLTESALLNLVINARDASPAGGKLTVETANKHLGEEYISERGEDIEPGNYVMMAVTDTGMGIDPDALGRIFEPFFTTKAIAKNSGLGLSMVHGFIKQTGGAIRVYSEPGVGTAFKLFFRAATGPSVPVQAPDPAVRVADAGVRVLLVEDENTVRRVLKRQLTQAGFSVTAASESASAERALKVDGPFDLMVSDIVMPGDLQGPALARRLRETDPDLPVIFLSGYPQEATVHGNGVLADDVMLMKPVSRDDLLRAISKVLRR